MEKTKLMISRISAEDILTTSGVVYCESKKYHFYVMSVDSVDGLGTMYSWNGSSWGVEAVSYLSGTMGQITNAQAGCWYESDNLYSGFTLCEHQDHNIGS